MSTNEDQAFALADAIGTIAHGRPAIQVMAATISISAAAAIAAGMPQETFLAAATEAYAKGLELRNTDTNATELT
jgi:hypothetical protein